MSELSWLVSAVQLAIAAGLGGVVDYFVVSRWPWAQGLPPVRKREVAMALAALLGVALKVGLIWLEGSYPATVQAWVATLVAAGASAAGVGQLVHAEKRLDRVAPLQDTQ